MEVKRFIEKLDDENANRFERFFSTYQEQHIAIPSALGSKHVLSDARGRICRFCGMGTPDVTFKKESHVIPQSIGNRYLVSNFECDKCNNFFGVTYENSFANFLSVSKVFARVQNQNSKSKTSKHKEPSRGLEIYSEQDAFKIIFSHLDENAFNIDAANKKATLTTIIPSYIPLYVYKTFVKIGLCLIDEGEIGNFINAFRFLVETSKDEQAEGNPSILVNIHSVPGVPLFSSPTAILYSRKSECAEELVPEKILVLYFANRIYQLFLPFNLYDRHLVGVQSSLITYPVLMSRDYFHRFGSPTTTTINLSSNKKKIGQQTTSVFSFEELHTY